MRTRVSMGRTDYRLQSVSTREVCEVGGLQIGCNGKWREELMWMHLVGWSE